MTSALDTWQYDYGLTAGRLEERKRIVELIKNLNVQTAESWDSDENGEGYPDGLEQGFENCRHAILYLIKSHGSL